jgi:predicted enzyme related to lactoylglutathione lyase
MDGLERLVYQVECVRRAVASLRIVEIEVAFVGVPVTDLATGQDFFERLLGSPPDVLVKEDEVMWRMAEAAWLYVVVDPPRAGHSLAALSVGDLDATLEELAARGINPSSVEQIAPASRKATVLDPDGNTVAIIEVS